MPPQSRAQRRRQAARQQQQSRGSAPARNPDVGRELPRVEADETGVTGTTIALGSPKPAAGESRRAESRPAARATRRVLSRPTPEPVDYSKDYAAVRRDLRWIALWTVLLFVAMVALKFSGLV